MKKILIISLLFLLFSCSNTDNKETWIIQETKQIISDYPDTLESSIQDAKKVTKQYNQNSKNLEESIKTSKLY
jgi:ABC-type transporter Mla subunit MlaD